MSSNHKWAHKNMAIKPMAKYMGILSSFVIMFVIYVYPMSMPKIFVKKKDLIFMGVYPFWHFGKLSVVVGGNKFNI
jgi:hypothetical protein